VSAFITYSAVEKHITAAFDRIRAERPHHNIVRYNSSGGGDGVPRWKTLGFYARTSADDRLVCEAFHDELRSAALIRVFRENPLQLLFGRKWAGDDGRFCHAVEAAADIFAQALPAEPTREQPADDISWLPIADEERATVRRALSPLPPPFSLAATQDA
jgi:hypothetical protein